MTGRETSAGAKQFMRPPISKIDALEGPLHESQDAHEESKELLQEILPYGQIDRIYYRRKPWSGIPDRPRPRRDNKRIIKVIIGSRDKMQGERGQSSKLRAARVDVPRCDSVRHYKAGRLSRCLMITSTRSMGAVWKIPHQIMPGSRAEHFRAKGPEHRAADARDGTATQGFRDQLFCAGGADREASASHQEECGRTNPRTCSSILAFLQLHADPNSPIYDAKSFAYDASKTVLNVFTITWRISSRNQDQGQLCHPVMGEDNMGGQSAPMELSLGRQRQGQPWRPLAEDGPTEGTSTWASRTVVTGQGFLKFGRRQAGQFSCEVAPRKQYNPAVSLNSAEETAC